MDKKPIEHLTYNELRFIRRALVSAAKIKTELAELVKEKKELHDGLLSDSAIINDLADRFEQIADIVLLAGPEESYNIEVRY